MDSLPCREVFRAGSADIVTARLFSRPKPLSPRSLLDNHTHMACAETQIAFAKLELGIVFKQVFKSTLNLCSSYAF